MDPATENMLASNRNIVLFPESWIRFVWAVFRFPGRRHRLIKSPLARMARESSFSESQLVNDKSIDSTEEARASIARAARRCARVRGGSQIGGRCLKHAIFRPVATYFAARFPSSCAAARIPRGPTLENCRGTPWPARAACAPTTMAQHHLAIPLLVAHPGNRPPLRDAGHLSYSAHCSRARVQIVEPRPDTLLPHASQ